MSVGRKVMKQDFSFEYALVMFCEKAPHVAEIGYMAWDQQRSRMLRAVPAKSSLSMASTMPLSKTNRSALNSTSETSKSVPRFAEPPAEARMGPGRQRLPPFAYSSRDSSSGNWFRYRIVRFGDGTGRYVEVDDSRLTSRDWLRIRTVEGQTASDQGRCGRTRRWLENGELP